MNNHDYHLEYLKQAMAEQPAPPCDACPHSHECISPDLCTPFRVYVETGKAVKPPRQLPTGENSNER